MAVPALLHTLLTTPGPSGDEAAPATAWRASAEAFAEVSADHVGSSVARVAGTAGGPLLAVVGHIDEIGLIVTHIGDDGFVYFRGVGGWDWQILVGQRVEVAARGGPVPGVVGRKPIHLLQDEERKKVVEARTLHIDIGAKDGDEARELVRVGDTAVIAGEPVELPNGRVASRSLDNRLGSFVAHEAARLVAEAGGGPGDVAALAVAQEEITFAGARTSAFSLEPDVAIVVDVTHATDVPGVEAKEVGSHPLGSRPGPHARLDREPATLRAASRHRRGRGHPVHGVGQRRLEPHRRRCLPPESLGRAHRRRVDPAALHALSGRDGAALRRRGLRPPDRRHGAAARGRRQLRSLGREGDRPPVLAARAGAA